MYKRIVQFISVLSLLILVVGGVWSLCTGMIKNQQFSRSTAICHVNLGNHAAKSSVDLHWEKTKELQQRADDRAIEKPEESDAKPSTNNAEHSHPILADLLYKNITFSLFSLLYNSKSFPLDTGLLITCYDSERIVFLQHFRI
ncbi:hypothetical protein [Sphingobacterium deserti]|uniref:Uncharacterized protein n=1 Tax=Sphingobacterium deserti TaxID=1229276 RepID=A0A0B8TAU7_9SPHI|nr:hypothetical protein [Sphingobacterium deserti]KGE15994.1 hypothetical protein DI53_0109 [Sphingobacterium deserti]